MIGLKVETHLGDARDRIDLSHANLTRLAVAAMRGMTPYVPWQTGQLSRSAHIEDAAVVYNPVSGGGTSYASYVYYKKRADFNRTMHPKATSEWAEAYTDSGAKEVVREVEKIIDGE